MATTAGAIKEERPYILCNPESNCRKYGCLGPAPVVTRIFSKKLMAPKPIPSKKDAINNTVKDFAIPIPNKPSITNTSEDLTDNIIPLVLYKNRMLTLPIIENKEEIAKNHPPAVSLNFRSDIISENSGPRKLSENPITSKQRYPNTIS